MRILYIDTSSSYLYSGIVQDDKLLCEIKKDFGQELSKVALPEIAKLFDICRIKPNDIDKIIVVNGPGSFTGIRIGITIAKVFAWSLNLPITTITSLEAMMLSSNVKTNYIPLIDARRSYVFAAIYSEEKKQILKPQHIKIEDLEKEITKLDNYIIISNDDIEISGKIEKYTPNILKIAQYFKNKQCINPHAVNPDYLKLTEAEESKL